MSTRSHASAGHDHPHRPADRQAVRRQGADGRRCRECASRRRDDRRADRSRARQVPGSGWPRCPAPAGCRRSDPCGGVFAPPAACGSRPIRGDVPEAGLAAPDSGGPVPHRMGAGDSVGGGLDVAASPSPAAGHLRRGGHGAVHIVVLRLDGAAAPVPAGDVPAERYAGRPSLASSRPARSSRSRCTCWGGGYSPGNRRCGSFCGRSSASPCTPPW